MKKPINLRISEELIVLTRQTAKKNGNSINWVIEEALARFFASEYRIEPWRVWIYAHNQFPEEFS